jgi:cytochrome c peroxidase
MRFFTVIALLLVFPGLGLAQSERSLSPSELLEASRLSLTSLQLLPADPTNRFADDPKAATLGKALFFDTRLSANGQVACASCHQPETGFQDGLALAEAVFRGNRRTMPLSGVQWGAWFFWDGRKDSQWSQALEPFENQSEHALTRADVTQIVLSLYKDEYEAVFGKAPDTSSWPQDATPFLPGDRLARWQAASPQDRDAIDGVYANIGKAIAAFERTLLPVENRFDRYVAAIMGGREPPPQDKLGDSELEGFRLFIGKARCATCHSGARLTDDFFHATGVPFSPNVAFVDFGRAAVLNYVRTDRFNCAGPHSDAPAQSCRELRFMARDPKVFEGAFKTPSLRGVANRPPYMHAGQIATLEDVIDHYDQAPDPYSAVPDINGNIVPHGRHTELQPLALTSQEKAALLDFLKAL